MPDPGLMPDYGLGQFTIPGYANLSTQVLGTPPPATPPATNVVAPPTSPPTAPPAPTGLPRMAPAPAFNSMAGLPPLPAPPRKIPVPEPPKPEHRDPLSALGRPLTLLALVASTFVRTPAIAAGNAMAAAIDAQRKGDRENYLEKYREYTQQIQKVAREQDQENRDYQALFNNAKLTYDQKIAQMRMMAGRRRDSLMLQALNGGNIGGTGGGGAGPGGTMTPVDLLAARFKIGKPITDAEMVFANAVEKMSKDKTLDFGTAVAQSRKEFETGKAEGKAAGTAVKPLTMTQEKARDIEARTKRIQAETPQLSEDEARSRAIAQVQAEAKAPPGAGWATLDPSVQNVVSAFPQAREDLASSSFKLSPQRQTQLLNGIKVIKENDRVAEYIKNNPDAVGVLPVIYNRYHATLVSQPTISFETPQEAAAVASRVADQQNRDIIALGGKFRLPDGRVLTPGLAEKAAVLNKMLIQAGLSDAAQMSASGRGGTIYMDRLMTERIYNQKTNPYTLLNFLADRSVPAVRLWRDLNDNIRLDSPDAPPNYRSQLLTPGGIEGYLGGAYTQGAGPPGSRLIGTTPDGKPVYQMPDGSKVVPR